jgi:hypothetical protein
LFRAAWTGKITAVSGFASLPLEGKRIRPEKPVIKGGIPPEFSLDVLHIVLASLLMLPFCAVLVYGFISFDRLLRIEHEQNRPAWEVDGRPAGFFWRARECSWMRSDLARGRLAFVWLFRTPSWVSDSAASTVALRRFRLAVLMWNIGVLLWLVILLSVS